MEIIFLENREELELKAANVIADKIIDILKNKSFINLALPGGRSVSGIFDILAQKDLPWAKVNFFVVDERLVPINNSESNFKLIKEYLLNRLLDRKLISEKNLHPFILNDSSEDKGIFEYETDLKKCGGSYDIILLSSGEDGHVGGLYPDHHSITDDSEYYIKMDDSPKPPKYRMSSSRKLLLRSKLAILLFLGEGKKEALNSLKQNKENYISLPARIVYRMDNSYIFTDIR